MEEKSLDTWGQLFDPALNNGILVLIYHPVVSYLFYTDLDCLLEQGICEYFIVLHVGTDPGTIGD